MIINKQGTTSIFRRSLLFAAVTFGLQTCSNDDGGVSSERNSSANATYKITFTPRWSETNFPTNFPGGAHFTALIGGTHNDQVVFWMPARNASDGLEEVAETGNQGTFQTEIEAAKVDGKAEFVLATSGNISAAGAIELEFDINETFPLVTLVSMVAPSPDWFVGVHGIPLLDTATGEFKQTVVVELKVYDAGTENGQSFSLSNADTQPKEPVALLNRIDPVSHDFVDGVGSDGTFIGTMTFERIK